MRTINLTFDADTMFDAEFERLYDCLDSEQVVCIAYAAELVSKTSAFATSGHRDTDDSDVENVIAYANDAITQELKNFPTTSYLNVYVGTIAACIGEYGLGFISAEDMRAGYAERIERGSYLLIDMFIDSTGYVFHRTR